ncbi:MAG: energy-coupling factor transporter ATPase [Faecalibacterium sp.]|nr:energy-coupling factor transporter ATPase [Ruminococcus sp.]MCM1392643.1 energy-coupling factor transporter ATPase [Ruminococcus sp.]MCM1486352.1 energy-coupling factor transporter ATPase [Faecalibacterium sp.]
MDNYIEFSDVSFKYDSEQPDNIINKINLTINKGDFVAVLGHNGCGKSTLAKLCNAIEIPNEGKVYIDGIDTSDDDRLYDIRQRVGMVFQNPDNQIVATIVEDDVAFGPENLGIEPSEIRKRVDDALKRVSMYEFRNFEPHKLSGGQKQRVAIAGIIAMKPECIVLDEPTAMLDPRGRQEVMDTVKMLNKDDGITVLFITHYMDEAVQANRVIVMDDGEIILDGRPKNVFTQVDTLKRVGLDVPEASELANLLIKDGIKLPKDILNVDELCNAVVNIMEE